MSSYRFSCSLYPYLTCVFPFLQFFILTLSLFSLLHLHIILPGILGAATCRTYGLLQFQLFSVFILSMFPHLQFFILVLPLFPSPTPSYNPASMQGLPHVGLMASYRFSYSLSSFYLCFSSSTALFPYFTSVFPLTPSYNPVTFLRDYQVQGKWLPTAILTLPLCFLSCSSLSLLYLCFPSYTIIIILPLIKAVTCRLNGFLQLQLLLLYLFPLLQFNLILSRVDLVAPYTFNYVVMYLYGPMPLLTFMFSPAGTYMQSCCYLLIGVRVSVMVGLNGAGVQGSV